MRLSWKDVLSKVQWRWAIVAGVGATVCTFALMSLTIAIYASVLAIVSGGDPDGALIERFATRMGAWSWPVLMLVFTGFAASWAARKTSSLVISQGALVGLFSGLSGSALGMAFSGAPPVIELVAILPMMGAGCLGALEARSALNRQKAFYDASRSIAAAKSYRDIVDAIGEHLADANTIQVALWQAVSEGDGMLAGITLHAAWQSQPSKTWRPGLHLETSLASSQMKLHREEPIVLRTGKLHGTERDVWESLGAQSVLLIPLATPAEEWVGILTVASPSRRGFRRSTSRRYMDISAQVELSLENQRLVEQGRKMGVMAERGRLAREIHDTLAQGFISIVTHLEVAEEELPPGSKPAQLHLDQARNTARENLVEARRLVAALRPEILEGSSLPEALERLANRWSEASGVSAKLTVTGDCEHLPQELQVALLRVAQEALSNVRKHAGASEATMTLSYAEDVVVLDVQDYGSGFDPDATPNSSEGGFGLQAMRERVEQFGGRLTIESAPGEGTTLAVQLPLEIVGETSRTPEDSL